jgi:hypothetical protein
MKSGAAFGAAFFNRLRCFLNVPGRESAYIYGAADLKSAVPTILKHLREESGAAFGATLYRDFVLFGATECNVENSYILFLNSGLFDMVRDRASQF